MSFEARRKHPTARGPGALAHGGWHRGIRVILNHWLHASMMNYNAVHRFGSNRSALVLGAAPKNEDTKLCTSMAPTRRDCSSSSRASSSRPLRARTDTCRDVLARALWQRPLAALRQDPRRPSGHGLRRVLQGSVVVEAGHLFTFDLRRAAGGGWCALNSSTTSAAMR